MYSVNDVHSKEGVYFKVFVALPLKVANVTRPCGHGLSEGTIITQVFPNHPQEVPCTVTDILCGGNHMYPLVQQLSCLFLGEEILFDYQDDLDPHLVLMRVRDSRRCWRCEERSSSLGASGSGIAKMWTWCRTWKKDFGR